MSKTYVFVGEICRRTLVKNEIGEITLYLALLGTFESFGPMFLDADRAYSDGIYNANDGPNINRRMRRTLYNITFDVILYSYIV